MHSITFHTGDKVYYHNHSGNETFHIRISSKQIFDLALVRYIGTTLFAEGLWVGIEFLSSALGKNDGSVNGHTYFQCRPNHGLFIRPNRISLTKK